MVEIPPYLKLIVDNAARRGSSLPSRPISKSGEVRTTSDSAASKAATEQPSLSNQASGDLVQLISKENRRSNDTTVPTAFQAENALRELERDLPSLGQQVGDLHQFPDRRRILVLLAPLVE